MPALSAVLARAFTDDPVMAWMWPEESARRRGLPSFFATVTRHHHLAHSAHGADVALASGRIGGAILWDPPGRWASSRWQNLRMMPGLLHALRSRIAVGGRVAEFFKTHHPREPHWYLAVVGTDPTHRGTGLGRALIETGLARCDAEHAPAYLESSKPENVPYYERFGFEVREQIHLPDGGPPLWPMWRHPR